MDLIISLIPMILILGVLWFIMIRPQKKRAEETQNMLNNLQTGDTVVTIGGMHGVIDEIDESLGRVVLDCEGVYLTFERRAIAKVTSKNDVGDTASTDELGTNTPETSDTDV